MFSKMFALIAGTFAIASISSGATAQETFKDKLVLSPEETCATGVPEAGDVVALALKGAKGRNYAIAGNSEKPRLAIRGEAKTIFSVFQFVPTATENAVAVYSLGHEKYVLMDEKTRLFATAEPASALLFELEQASEGYFRIKVHGYQSWMRMNTNGYLDFRAKQQEAATIFCAQAVASD